MKLLRRWLIGFLVGGRVGEGEDQDRDEREREVDRSRTHTVDGGGRSGGGVGGWEMRDTTTTTSTHHDHGLVECLQVEFPDLAGDFLELVDGGHVLLDGVGVQALAELVHAVDHLRIDLGHISGVGNDDDDDDEVDGVRVSE